jgi:hypothetical protein
VVKLRNRFCVVLGLLPVVAWLGCADPSGGREPVSGEVRFRGQPLDQGTIQFIPSEEQDTTSGGMISEGKYTVEKVKGLKPGKYTVVISSGDPREPAPPGELPGAPFPVAKERIPAEYNRATKQEVEIKKGGPNKLDFTIP